MGWRKQVACPETGQILLSARVTPPPSPFSHPPISACLRPWSDRAQIWGYFSPHRARSHSHSTQQQTPAITGWNRHLKTAIIFVWVGSCGVSPLEILWIKMCWSTCTMAAKYKSTLLRRPQSGFELMSENCTVLKTHRHGNISKATAEKCERLPRSS